MRGKPRASAVHLITTSFTMDTAPPSSSGGSSTDDGGSQHQTSSESATVTCTAQALLEILNDPPIKAANHQATVSLIESYRDQATTAWERTTWQAVLDVITTVDVSTLLAGYNIVDPATGSLVPNLVLDLESITDIEGMVLQCSFDVDTVEWQCNNLTFCTELQFVPDLTRW